MSLAATGRVVLRAWRLHWRLLLAIWLVMWTPFVIYAVTAIPEYRAIGALQVSRGSGLLSEMPLADLAGSPGAADVETEVEILRRRDFLAKVLEAEGLDIVGPDAGRAFTVDPAIIRGQESPVSDEVQTVREAIGAHELDPLRRRAAQMRIAWDGKRTVTVTEAETGEKVSGQLGESLEVGPLRVEFAAPPTRELGEVSVVFLPRGVTLEWYLPRIEVRSLGDFREPTNLVQVAATLPDREEARDLVDAIMAAYLEQSLKWQNQSAGQAARFIEGQLSSIEENLLRSEAAFQDYAEAEDAIALETQAKVEIEKLAELEAQRIAIGLELEGLTSARRRLGKSEVVAPATLATSVALQEPTVLQELRALATAASEYEQLRSEFTDEHPRVQKSRAALEQRRNAVKSIVRAAEQSLRERASELDEALSKSTDQLKRFPELQLRGSRILRDVEVNKRLYTMLLEKREEAEILKASTTTDKRVVDRPSVPHKKVSPRRGRIVAAGLIVALFLACCLTVVRHLLNRKIGSAEDAKELVGFPLYALVPLVESSQDSSSRVTVREIWREAHGGAAEAFRSLAVNASLVPAPKDRGRVVLVVSGSPGEGKSTVASNLAVALGRAGRRTLLVDLDLRRPVQHRTWESSRAPGFSDVLARGSDGPSLESELRKGVSTGVDFLPAGTPMPDSAAAILSPRLKELLERWASNYDFVVVDSPPMFVAETGALVGLASLALLVVRPTVADKRSVGRAADVLGKTADARGLVLNGVERRHLSGDSYYYYYASSDYGPRDETAGDPEMDTKNSVANSDI